MALGWVLDKSAAVRSHDPAVRRELDALAGRLYLCPIGLLERLYSARSAGEYDGMNVALHEDYPDVACPDDIFKRAQLLQRDLAHHRGLWHRISIPDLLIAETALFHGMGVVHVDGDYERIAQVRPLQTRPLTPSR